MVSNQAGRRPWRARPSATVVALGLLVLVFAAIYATFSLVRLYTFNAGTYDLVIFDQAVRSYAHFHPGISIAKGMHNFFNPNFSVLGDHWSPIIASLAPFYWLYNGPQTLLVAQGILFALAIPPIWLFTRRALGGGQKATVAAYLVAVAYGLSWPVAAAVAFDFHEVAFAPVLIAVALERLQAGKIRPALLALAGLLLVKEDMGLLVAGIGCYLLLSRQHLTRQRLLAAGLIVAGLVATGVATYVLIPALGGRSNYYWAYTAMGKNMPQLLQHLIAHPASSFKQLFTPRIKVDTLLWLFGAFAFLPLLSPISIALIPLILERFLANIFPNWWSTNYQYNAYMIAILVLAALDGGARLGRWVEWAKMRWTARSAQPASAQAAEPAGVASATAGATRAAPGFAGATMAGQAHASERLGAEGAAADGPTAETSGSAGGPPAETSGSAGGPPAGAAPAARAGGGGRRSQLRLNVALGAAGVMFVLAFLLVPKFSFDPALSSSFYQRTPAAQAGAEAISKVPAGVVVAAANNVGPELSGRDTVVLWDGDGDTPATYADWVVANVGQREFTFSSLQDQIQSVNKLKQMGYKVVFSRGGYIVLHRVS
jgi:uncharacterized membrane protein